MKFYQTDLGKIMGKGIHDHNSGIGLIASYITFIEWNIEKGKIVINEGKEELLKDLEHIKNARTRCRDSVDYMYSKIKEYSEELENT